MFAYANICAKCDFLGVADVFRLLSPVPGTITTSTKMFSTEVPTAKEDYTDLYCTGVPYILQGQVCLIDRIVRQDDLLEPRANVRCVDGGCRSSFFLDEIVLGLHE